MFMHQSLNVISYNVYPLNIATNGGLNKLIIS